MARGLQRANGSESLAQLDMLNGPGRCGPSHVCGVGAADIFLRYQEAGIRFILVLCKAGSH